MRLHDILKEAQSLSQHLNDEDVAECKFRPNYPERSSCMARATEAKDNDGRSVPFDQFEAHVSMCDSCRAYWLSCRLVNCLIKLSS